MRYQSPEFIEKCYRDLVHLCRNGSAKEVLAQIRKIRKCDYLSWFLESYHYVRSYGPISGRRIDRVLSPVESAIWGNNLEVLRLFLMLGADPNAEYGNEFNKVTPYSHAAADRPQALALFDSAFPWWNMSYTTSQCHELQARLAGYVSRGAFSDIMWHGLRGLRLESPDLLVSKEFEKAPRSVRELVGCLCVPDEMAADYLRWLIAHHAAQESLEALQKEHDDSEELLERFSLSIGLLTEEKLEMLANIALKAKNPIGLLKHLTGSSKARSLWQDATIVRKLMETICKSILMGY